MNRIYLTGAALIAMLAPIAAQAAEALPQAVRASASANADFARGEGRGQGRGGGNANRGDNGARGNGGQSQAGRGESAQRQGGQNQGSQARGNWGGNRGGQVAARPAAPSAPVVRENRGQASGQYQRSGNDNRGDWNRNDNRGQQNWNRSWRNDNRYDWRSHRQSNRNFYRPGRYYAPYNNYRYSRISIGFTLGSPFFSSNYWINDPWQYRLPVAYGDYRWVRYYDDVLLIDLRTGYVVDVIENFFW